MASTKKSNKKQLKVKKSKELPTVSLLFINYNGEKYLKRCFGTLFQTKYPQELLEVIFVDSDSTDGSVSLVRKKFPQIRIVEGVNDGYGSGANRGFSQSRGELVGVMNVDLEFTKNWLKPLVEMLQSSPKVGITAPVLIPLKDYPPPKTMEICGFTPYGFAYSHKIRYQKKPIESVWIMGAVMLIKRKVFEKIKGFDPLIYLYYEDFDLCYRSYLLGFSSVLVPESTVKHKQSGLVDPNIVPTRKIILGTQNNTMVMLKNFSGVTLFFFFPIYLLIKIGDIITDIIHYEHLVWAGAKVKGFFLALRLLPQILSERRKIQNKRIVSDWEIFKYNPPVPFYETVRTKILGRRDIGK